MLSKKQIKKFQIIYKKHFGKKISKKETVEKGVKLVRLVELIYKPLTKDEYSKFKTPPNKGR